MAQQFDGLPLTMLHAVTINFALAEVGDSLANLCARYKKALRKALMQNLNHGAIVRGKLDVALKYADELQFELEEADLPEALRGQRAPHKRFGMLHIHFMVFDPWMTKDEVRDVLTKCFPGKNRVCVRRPYEDVVRPNGTVTHGVQGYLEYLSMEKVELDFGDESVDAVVEFAELDETWSRSNRNFALGKLVPETFDLIDPTRLTELERLQRTDWLKKNFSKLSFAERFLHVWLSNAKQVLNHVGSQQRMRRLIGWMCSSPSFFCNSALAKASQVIEMLTNLIWDGAISLGKREAVPRQPALC